MICTWRRHSAIDEWQSLEGDGMQSGMISQFATAVAGGTCGALLTQCATLVRDQMNKRSEARITALTLALLLEDYAYKCTWPVSIFYQYVSSKGRTSEPNGSIPALPEYSDKIDWRAIGIEQAEIVLSFRMAVGSASVYVAEAWEIEGQSDAWAAASDKSVELGIRSLDIAKQLRRAFKIPARMIERGFDVRAFLEDEATIIAAREPTQTMWPQAPSKESSTALPL